MLTSLSHERQLEAARAFYMERGYLPLDVEVDLALAGCIVEELYRAWDNELINAVEALA